MDYADYVEQLTYLLFLKMADEGDINIPEDCRWYKMLKLDGDLLKTYYNNALQILKNEKGILGQIFQEPISKIQNPVNLKKIIDGIEEIGWTKLDKDVQGEAFEGLLERTANEGKKGAGQFFTPRPLIQAIVNVLQPDPLEKEGFKIADVACGTSGFLTVAADWATKKYRKIAISNDERNYICYDAYYGQELVVRPYRLGLMNMYLHGINANLTLGDSIYGENQHPKGFDCILTNPPFGSRGVIGIPKERNFAVETSNIQINFIQHVYETLKNDGRAAIVLPDSVLTDTKARELWQNLITLRKCNIHTILKLPKGTFNPYANGVKACVVFIEKGQETRELWVYDARTSVDEIKKNSRPLEYNKHFADFVSCYGNNPNGRADRKEKSNFERFSLEEVKIKNFDLSFNKTHVPEDLENPIYYVDKLIETFEQQVADLHKLKSLLEN